MAEKKLCFKFKFIIIFIMLMVNSLSYSEQNFGPWDPEINISDDNISNHDLGIFTKNPSEKLRTVYNGFQGGAFIMIVLYQTLISPQDGPNCRHDPVCSAYGKKAVEKFGALFGAILAGDRLLRCNPYYPPSKDPVPNKVFD